jgi:hypothetical protein
MQQCLGDRITIARRTTRPSVQQPNPYFMQGNPFVPTTHHTPPTPIRTAIPSARAHRRTRPVWRAYRVSKRHQHLASRILQLKMEIIPSRVVVVDSVFTTQNRTCETRIETWYMQLTRKMMIGYAQRVHQDCGYVVARSWPGELPQFVGTACRPRYC